MRKCPSFENVIRDLPGCVYWKDCDGVYLGCNKVFLEMVGMTSDKEVIGKTDYDFSWKKDANMLREHDAFVLSSGKVQSLEEEVTLVGGERRLYSVVKAPLFNEQANQVIGIVGTSIDVTDRKRLEERLAETKIREAHFKAMSALGGMMAHELRTPLASIALNASSIKDFFPILVKAYREYSKIATIEKIRLGHLDSLERIAEDIEVSALYAGNTIKTILSGFRYSASESFPLKEIDVNAVIRQALQEYPLSKEEKAFITFEPTGQYKALAAPKIIIHVLHNLLKNALYAIQAANKGVITISVKKTNAGVVHIQFRDTATGIPEAIRAHIFESFYTTKDSETSIGLGLYFCKMALEKMEASITCESEEGKYTLFTIKLKTLPNKLE